MRLRIFSNILVISILLYSCADYKAAKKNKKYYASSGFALLYEEKLHEQNIINKKIKNENLQTIHNILKINTPIKIVNPENLKFVETKVYKKGNYPKIFNIVINKEIFKILDLDEANPYVEIYEIKKNKKFVAKKSNTFEEEKNVAEVAPVNKINIDDLSKERENNKKKNNQIKKFIIVINDFYYQKSAISLKLELETKTKFKNIRINKINDTKYRLLVGPFENFSALKTVYISLNNLGFEYLDIYNK